MLFLENKKVLNENISLGLFSISNFSLTIKREDILHPDISGNKFRKLKYNLIEADNQGKNVLLTFGGAFSNHIAALAAAGNEFGFKTIGVIRGEEIINKINENPTLSFARSCGMQFHFVSREAYRNKENLDFIENLKSMFGDFYLVPEGGTNALAIKGCEEILTENDKKFDYICTAVGTGGTISGIIKSSTENKKVIGFSALKGTFQTSEVVKYTSKNNFIITDDYCFGGYAKIDSDLVRFINEFKEKTGIPIDPVYTGKMMFGIFDLLKKGYFKENSSILAIHTGGLQGISGMNQFLKKKNLPQIIV